MNGPNHTELVLLVEGYELVKEAVDDLYITTTSTTIATTSTDTIDLDL